jgi:hypothetical protein
MTTKPKVTEYSFCELPEGIDSTVFTVRVQYAGRGLWAVRWLSECLSADGNWDYEPNPSSRDDEWLNAHRWCLRDALTMAGRALPKLEVNGRTARQILAGRQNESRALVAASLGAAMEGPNAE